MKQQPGNRIKLGLFVLGGTFLFIAAIYLIGQKHRMFTGTFQVHALFKDVTGLQPGNNVRFAGINQGTVQDIEIISDTVVRVEMIIDEHIRKFIKKDAIAVIGSEGPLGNKTIMISPGSAGLAIQNNDAIRTVTTASMDDILAKIKVTADNAATITDDLAVIMTNIRSGKGAIGKFFMDTAFAVNMDQTLVNLKQASGGIKQNMDAASHSFLLRGGLKRKEKEREKEREKEKEKAKGN
jgi:phospholipid/cholesterol/gamma-HCH transport system substrate-binding protein